MNKIFCSLLSIFYLILVFSACSKSNRDASRPKIIGGQSAGAHRFMVGLIYASDDKRVFCGAALIERDVVLTAAHCVEDATKDVKVMMGTSSANLQPDKLVGIKAIFVHPDYQEAQGADMQNDIALIFLEDYDASKFGELIEPIALNQDSAMPEAEGSIKVIGWGNTTSYGRIFRDELREVNIPTVSSEKCNEVYQGGIVNSQICAADFDHGGIDSCQGDSGGPAVISKDGKLQLVGIVSWGHGCAQKNRPGVYTRVSSFADWISSTSATYRHLKPQQFTGSLFTEMVKAHCLAGFRSESTQQADQRSLKIMRSYLPGDAFVSASVLGDLRSGNSIAQCEFDTARAAESQRVLVNLVNAPDGLRFEAGVGEKKYIAGAYEKLAIQLQCPGETNVEFVYDSTQGSFLALGDARYITMNGSDVLLDGYTSKAECALDNLSVRVLAKYNDDTKRDDLILVQRGSLFRGGVKVLRLFDVSNFRAEVRIKISDANDKRGSLALVNNSDLDIYTWQLACNQGFSLTDQNGAVYQADKKDDYYVHEFIQQSHSLGTLKIGQRVDFTFESPEPISRDLSCRFNGMPVDIEFAKPVSQAS